MDKLRLPRTTFRTSADMLDAVMAAFDKGLQCEVCRSRFQAALTITKAVLAERARHVTDTPMIKAEL